MAKYYVNDNAQPSGDHEVHKEGCSYLAEIVSKTYLGDFLLCHGAVAKAKGIYPKSNGCYYFSRECHTS